MARLSVYGVKDIAARAGVSTATVSRVLNNHPGVSEDVRQSILSLMKSSLAPTRALHRPPHILVVVGASVGGYLSEITSGIAKYTLEHRTTSEFVFDLKTRADLDFLRFVRERRCDGVLELSVKSRPEEVVGLSRLGIPVMVIAEKIEQPHSGYLMIDSAEGACRVVNYLLLLGHREIFFLANGRDQSSDLFLRRQGFLRGMQEAGLPVHARRVVEHIPDADTQRSGYLQTQILLAESPEATAIFAANDEMAYGAMLACREKGLSVPGDVSVVGVDDYRYSSFWNPRLTTLKQPLAEFGYEAMHCLDMYVSGLIEELPKKIVPGNLVVRESCAAPRG